MGFACQGIKIIESSEDLEKDNTSSDSRMILKFVEGEAASVKHISKWKVALHYTNKQKNKNTIMGY